MTYAGDIREYKKKLRERYRAERQKLSPAKKMELDETILNRFLRLNQYNNSRLLLTYVSTPLEIDTRSLIDKALEDGKIVAVPRCVEGTRNMNFYTISSMEDLSPGSFGVLEPQADEAKLVTDFSESICVVPGFCFDNHGYRLGYGKGYYDRFLSDYSGVKVGLSYSGAIRTSLNRGRFDCAVDVLVTERFIRSTVLSK